MNNAYEFNPKGLKIFLFIYAIILVLFSFLILPNNDSFYYWGWSQHLQISYFDGPPMIAYALRLATIPFGHSIFAMNIVGAAVALITTFVVAAIVNLLTDQKNLGLLIGVLWLTDPLAVTNHIIVAVTYDGLVNLFEFTTLLFALKYIKHRKPASLYYIGIFGGLSLLSKYTGILELTGIIIFFIYQKELRTVFKSIHVYLAMLICTVIFSPVLIWNYQHNWASFTYQFHDHIWENQALLSTSNIRTLPVKFKDYIWSAVIGPMVVYYLILIFLATKKKLKQHLNQHNSVDLSIKLILTIMGGVFLFWLCLTPIVMVDLIYLLTFNGLILILTGYFLLKNQYYKFIIFLIAVSSVISISKMVVHSVVPDCPSCYQKYIKGKILKFNSPLIKYIKEN